MIYCKEYLILQRYENEKNIDVKQNIVPRIQFGNETIVPPCSLLLLSFRFNYGFLGDKSKSYPPYKFLKPSNMVDKNSRRRFL